MKKYLIGTSWKMNKTLGEALDYCAILAKGGPLPDRLQPFVIPPFTAVREVTRALQRAGLNCLTGVQNMHFADRGAFTGEISPLMVKDTGATLVEMGHSERREFFGETNETVRLKAAAALSHGLTPLICIGDSLQEKCWGVSKETVIRQMKAALAGLRPEQVAGVIIAYEPIWAIGEQGVPATPEEAQAIHRQLYHALAESYGAEIADRVPLLYGGSVNHDNALTLLALDHVDGLFVGRAAWEGESYRRLLDTIAATL
ncbi:triose-phosphate isomerase [Sodalis sp. RH21]|uniref:triose-phosphate isomerase n=1 Tax=unclassified Sodalis (in: enterobacteria) TaxID=2636512 RepID=UPI0039B37329